MEMKNDEVAKGYPQIVRQQQQQQRQQQSTAQQQQQQQLLQMEENVMHHPMDMSNHHLLTMRNMSVMMEQSVPHHLLQQQQQATSQQQQHGHLQQQQQQTTSIHMGMLHNQNSDHQGHLAHLHVQAQSDSMPHDLSGLTLQSEMDSMQYATHKLTMTGVGGEANFHGDEQQPQQQQQQQQLAQQCVMSNEEADNLISLIDKEVNPHPDEGLLLDPSTANNCRLSDGSNDGDNDDGHRPLKKRRQRRLVKPVNSSSSMYTSTSGSNEMQSAGPSTSIGKASLSRTALKNKSTGGGTSFEELRDMAVETKQINTRLRRHQLILGKMVDVLVQLATQLGDKFYLFLTGKPANIELVKLIELIQGTLEQLDINDKEVFLNQMKTLNEQYQMLLDDRSKSEQDFTPAYLYTSPEDDEDDDADDDFGQAEDLNEEVDENEEVFDDDIEDANYKLKSRGTRKAKTGGKSKASATAMTKRKKLKRKRAANASTKPSARTTTTTSSSKNKIFYCDWPNCSYETKREWALNEHTNITHTGQKQFACKVEECQQTFYTSAELDIHMKRTHSDIASKEFMSCTWPGCNALFKSKLGLRGHLRTHKGEDMIACDWPGCTYMAKNKRQSENHQRKHTGDRPYRCSYNNCQSSFRTNDSLRHHRKCHSDYRPFWCDWPGCDANFKTNRGLHLHRVLHTGEKIWRCTFGECEFASERKYHVDLHIYENHTHTKPFQCNWIGCEASFLRNDKLQNHLKIHRQEKPYKCIEGGCDKHFVEKGNMMKHFNNVHKRD